MPWPSAISSIGILVLTPADFELPLADIHAAARAPLVEETALEIAPLDLFSESLRQEAVRTCAGKPACFVDKFDAGAGAGSVDVLLVVTVADLGEQWLVGLRAVGAGASRGEDLARVGAEADKAAPLEKTMRRLLPQLLPRSLWGQVGHVEVTSEPPGAAVTLGGKTCQAPCRFDRLVPDRYRLQAEVAGHLPYEGSVEVEAGRTVEHAATLIEQPREPGIVESPWFWTGVGVVVVGAAVGIFFAARSDPADEVCVPASACP